MAFARVLLPSVTTRNHLLVGRTRSKNDGRRHRATRKAAVFSASLRDDNDDEPITTIAGKAVAAVVATAVALSAPTRASAEEAVRFCHPGSLVLFARAHARAFSRARVFLERKESRIVEYLFLSLYRARDRDRALCISDARKTDRSYSRIFSVSDDKRSD